MERTLRKAREKEQRSYTSEHRRFRTTEASEPHFALRLRAKDNYTLIKLIIVSLVLLLLVTFNHKRSNGVNGARLLSDKKLDQRGQIVWHKKKENSIDRDLASRGGGDYVNVVHKLSARNSATPIGSVSTLIKGGNLKAVSQPAKLSSVFGNIFKDSTFGPILNNNDHQLLSSQVQAGKAAIVESSTREHLLPNGAPPYRPSMLIMGSSTSRALDLLKGTSLFRGMFKSKAYYLFLDVLRQLSLIVDRISRKKMDLSVNKLESVQSIVNKLALKGGHSPFKLQWPLVLLQPNFLRQLISSPAFLVMLFNAVENAYVSMPEKLWLKSLMKLVRQPSPEKEEQIWWRRKRLYDTLNGHGSSELEPNLKAVHFRVPGEPAPVAFPKLVGIARKISKKPGPNPNHYKYSKSAAFAGIDHYDFVEPQQSYVESAHEQLMQLAQPPQDSSSAGPTMSFGGGGVAHQVNNAQHYADYNLLAHQQQQQQQQLEASEPPAKSSTLVDEDDWSSQQTLTRGNSLPVDDQNGKVGVKFDYRGDWWAQPLPSADQLMSQHEFDSLDSQDRDIVMREARKRFEESKWANELISQYSQYVESLVSGQQHQHQQPQPPPPPMNSMPMTTRRQGDQRAPYFMKRSSLADDK